MEPKDINLRSDEVNEIFTKMPSHLVRWGNTWILIVIICLFTLAYYMRYPDIITGSLIMSSSSAPVSIISQTNGNIKLLKENYSKISIDETIGYTTADANLADVDSVYKLIHSKDLAAIDVQKLPAFSLGKIQSNWSRFLVELEAYNVYAKSNPEQIGIASSSKQIQKNSQSVSNLREQIISRENQIEFYKKKVEKDKLLVDKGMIPEREYQNSYSQYLEMQNQLKSLKSNLITIDKDNTNYQKQIADYHIAKTQTESQKLTNIQQLRINLIEEIDQWYKVNTFKSPIDGTLQYDIPIVDNQFILQGTELFTVTPVGKSEVECSLLVPMNGMGKVEIGQQVIMRLHHYPEEEFGVLQGKVAQISPSAIVSKTSQGSEKFYSIKVDLNNGLMTSYKKEIAYQPNMEGTADIITKDRSFLERIFEQLLKLIKR